jgi:hypothetical protein
MPKIRRGSDATVVGSPESAAEFVATFQRLPHDGDVEFVLSRIDTPDGEAILVVMLGKRAFAFDPDSARTMADSFEAAIRKFPDMDLLNDFANMVLGLRASADRIDRENAARTTASMS